MLVIPTKLLAVTLLLFYSAAGCGTVSGERQTVTGSDLTERFSLVRRGPVDPRGEEPFVRHYEVVRNGVRRDSMLLIAPAEIRAPLAGIKGSVVLEGLATPVFNIGDGIQMDVFLADARELEKVFGCRFDPGRKAQDRAWIPLEIPLELDGTPDSQMAIRVSAGDQGDLVADWLALSSMRIVQKESGR